MELYRIDCTEYRNDLPVLRAVFNGRFVSDKTTAADIFNTYKQILETEMGYRRVQAKQCRDGRKKDTTKGRPFILLEMELVSDTVQRPYHRKYYYKKPNEG